MIVEAARSLLCPIRSFVQSSYLSFPWETSGNNDKDFIFNVGMQVCVGQIHLSDGVAAIGGNGQGDSG